MRAPSAGSFGFISNIYVVTVIALYKPMHKQLTNIIITNQSVIDATVAFFLFFTTLFEDDKRKRTPGNASDEAICRLWYTKVCRLRSAENARAVVWYT